MERINLLATVEQAGTRPERRLFRTCGSVPFVLSYLHIAARFDRLHEPPTDTSVSRMDGSPKEPIVGNVGEDPPLAARAKEPFLHDVRTDREGQHIDGGSANRTMEGEPPELQPGIVYTVRRGRIHGWSLPSSRRVARVGPASARCAAQQ